MLDRASGKRRFVMGEIDGYFLFARSRAVAKNWKGIFFRKLKIEGLKFWPLRQMSLMIAKLKWFRIRNKSGEGGKLAKWKVRLEG